MVSQNSGDNDKKTPTDLETPKAPYAKDSLPMSTEKINKIKDKEKSKKELKDRLAEAKANYKLEQKLKEIKNALKIKNFKKSQEKLEEEVEKLEEKEQVLEEKLAELATNPEETEYANLILEQLKTKMIEVSAKEELANDTVGVKIARKTVSNLRKAITNILKGVKDLLKAETTKSLNQRKSELQFDVDEVKATKRKKKVIVNMFKEAESELSVPEVENKQEEVEQSPEVITDPLPRIQTNETEKEVPLIKESEIIEQKEEVKEPIKETPKKSEETKPEKIPTPPLDQIAGHKEEPLEISSPEHDHKDMQLEIRPEELK